MGDLYDFLPGFLMGISRSIVSHPFEILKIKSQLGISKKIPIFSGLQYSLLASGIERGIQFYFYDYFRKDESNLSASLKSSVLSTCISLPYNYTLIRKSILDTTHKIVRANAHKCFALEYTRSLTGSFLFMYSYNRFKEEKLPSWLCAFGGTSVVWSITYPIDTFRNRIMSGKPYNLMNLYRGIQFPLLRSIPSSIFGMYVYEKTKEYLSQSGK